MTDNLKSSIRTWWPTNAEVARMPPEILEDYYDGSSPPTPVDDQLGARFERAFQELTEAMQGPYAVFEMAEKARAFAEAAESLDWYTRGVQDARQWQVKRVLARQGSK